MSLLTSPNVRNSHILAVMHFISLKERPRLNLEVFQYQIWTSVKSSKIESLGKANFNLFLQLSFSNFRLNLH